MGGVIASIGTPTSVPKPRGNSPGWPTGKVRKPKERAPVLKKEKKPNKQLQQQAKRTKKAV
jgi:hypothetical protein